MTEQPNPAALLESVATVEIPASAQPFAIRDRFESPGGVRFAAIWHEFKRRFYGKTEGPIGATTLRKYKLLKIAPDGPIIAELGGGSKVECPVAAAFALLSRQPRGSDGILQNNGYANIFYSRDQKNVLCAIRVGWDGEGWVVDAISVEDPLAWNGKHEIFCPVAAPGAP